MIIGDAIAPSSNGIILAEKVIDRSGVYYAANDGVSGYSKVKVQGTGGGSNAGLVECYYPAGQGITATDGVTTLQGDTSGHYTFQIPNSGEWEITSGQVTKQITVVDYALNFRGIQVLQDVYWKGSGSTDPSGISTLHATDKYGAYQLLIISINSEASSHRMSPAVLHNNVSVSPNELLYQGYDSGRSGNPRNCKVSSCSLTLTGDDYISISLTDPSGFTVTLALLLQAGSVTSLKEVRSSNDARFTASFSQTSGVDNVIYGAMNGAQGYLSYTAEIYSSGTVIDTGDVPHGYGAGFIFGVS